LVGRANVGHRENSHISVSEKELKMAVASSKKVLATVAQNGMVVVSLIIILVYIIATL
jgi:hypothetical protein